MRFYIHLEKNNCNKMLIKKYTLYMLLFLTLGLISTTAIADVFSTAAKFYCKATNPSQVFQPYIIATCEQQHTIQQQDGGRVDTTVYWSGAYHTATDRKNMQAVWSNKQHFDLSELTYKKPYEDNPALIWGESDQCTEANCYDLVAAYKMGTYGLRYHLIWTWHEGSKGKRPPYDVSKGESTFLTTKWDGVSHLLYGISWVVNIPQKVVNYGAFILDGKGKDKKIQYWLFLDFLLLLIVIPIELILAVLGTVSGIVVGTVLNPLDTLFNIPNGIFLLAQTLWVAFSQFFVSVYNMVTAHWSGFIILILTLTGMFKVIPKVFEGFVGRD